MKKFAFAIILLLFPFSPVFWDYELENWSKELVKKYNLNVYSLEKELTRKEFIETLYSWYDDYKARKWVKVDYSKYKQLDNSKVFTDVDLSSDFGKKLSYFASVWAFSKNKTFNPNWTVSQKDYFIVMSRLRIMFSLSNCKALKICDFETTKNSPFLKWTYYKYTSKIMDPSLRKYYRTAWDYINAGYKPYLTPNYRFPILKQTLNWCYAYTVRNILKYKHWIGVYVQKWEEYIWKAPEKLWYSSNMAQFDKLVHVTKESAYNIDTLINSLQAWEPVSVSYILKYKTWKWEEKSVWHIVAAYSFDEKWVWVSETVANKRIRIPWEELFNSYWNVKYHRIFKYTYEPISEWTKTEKDLEAKHNFLAWEK